MPLNISLILFVCASTLFAMIMSGWPKFLRIFLATFFEKNEVIVVMPLEFAKLAAFSEGSTPRTCQLFNLSSDKRYPSLDPISKANFLFLFGKFRLISSASFEKRDAVSLLLLER